ncbi:MAG: LPS assembly lipoprotein LptE [Planctomycetota bacterium]
MTPARSFQRLVLTLAVLAGALLGTSCGYSVGYETYGPSGRRVTLEVVGNATLRQRFERPITRALEEEIPIHSNWTLVGPGSADYALRTKIVTVDGSNLAGGTRLSPVREGGLDFALTAELVDLRSGRIVREAEILDRAEFRAAVGETEATALLEASRDIARKIVQRLENPL